MNIKNDKLRMSLTRFRLSAHNLAIETGRYFNIDREDRLCLLCNQRNVESEYHFLLVCTKYRELRSKYLLRYSSFPTVHKFFSLMTSKSSISQINVAKFIHESMKLRSLECD